jgi:hypothetical protein
MRCSIGSAQGAGMKRFRVRLLEEAEGQLEQIARWWARTW